MQKKRSGSSRYFFFFLVCVVLIYGAYIGINSLFTKLDLFKVKSIKISGNENLETDFLKNICNDFINLNLYSISKKDVLKKYENIIRIDDIKVSRIFPNKLKIEISEKKGEFFFRTESGTIFPLDKNRVVLDNVNFYENEVLPVIGTKIPNSEIIIGTKVENVLIEEVFSLKKKFANVNPDFIKSISEFYLKDENLILVNANIGYRIVLGNNEIEEKLKRLIFLEQNRTFEKGTTIDLRFKDQLVISSEEI
ncbi:MAG: FtsQ-type POTRA domain-containing protein [Candidatus Cloacimonetes bacterium]|jgi:cell division protein FtsQ|nr:FtsQ-type POTRA domain-containing protein [Candidatus Cloacimonadota bacterium]